MIVVLPPFLSLTSLHTEVSRVPVSSHLSLPIWMHYTPKGYVSNWTRRHCRSKKEVQPAEKATKYSNMPRDAPSVGYRGT